MFPENFKHLNNSLVTTVRPGNGQPMLPSNDFTWKLKIAINWWDDWYHVKSSLRGPNHHQHSNLVKIKDNLQISGIVFCVVGFL